VRLEGLGQLKKEIHLVDIRAIVRLAGLGQLQKQSTSSTPEP
jgi:hypothetical protein